MHLPLKETGFNKLASKPKEFKESKICFLKMRKGKVTLWELLKVHSFKKEAQNNTHKDILNQVKIRIFNLTFNSGREKKK